MKRHQIDFEEKMEQMERYRAAIQFKVAYYTEALAEWRNTEHTM